MRATHTAEAAETASAVQCRKEATGKAAMPDILIRLQTWLDATRKLDFLGPLALRLYLVPVFWVTGTNKLGAMDVTGSPRPVTS